MNDAQKLIRDIEQELSNVKVKIAEVTGEVDNLKDKATALEKTIDSLAANKVDVKEFSPVRSLVYGLVGLILTAVILAIVGLVLKR